VTKVFQSLLYISFFLSFSLSLVCNVQWLKWSHYIGVTFCNLFRKWQWKICRFEFFN
jgi:hypothetical protein